MTSNTTSFGIVNLDCGHRSNLSLFDIEETTLMLAFNAK